MSVKMIEKKDCVGCAKCVFVCPQKCITMQEDLSGFLYPCIDEDKCVDCELCEKQCSQKQVDTENENSYIQKVYAAKSLDEQIRYNSTSGGIFSELAKHIIQNGGYVVGAAYGKNNKVEHILIDNDNDIAKIRQSKYVQSDMNNIYEKIQEKLLKGKVLFCGTPCQVAAVKRVKQFNVTNLITVDFVCRGVNSPKAYREWLKELEQNIKSRVCKVWFKYKINGWKKSPRCTRIDFENGENIVQFANENLFMRGYLETNLYMRPSCAECHFKNNNSGADITVGDFWGLNQDFDDDKGTSLVVINSSTGDNLFEKIKHRIWYIERAIQEVNNGNPMKNNSVVLNPDSDKFLAELGTGKPFSKMIKGYILNLFCKKVKQFIRKIYKKLFS